MEVYKRKDNNWTGMPSFLLIAFYFVLHASPLFWPSGQQHVLQATLEQLVTTTL